MAELNICSGCALHAHVRFDDGQESKVFPLYQAPDFVGELAQQNRISMEDFYRFITEIKAWISRLSHAHYIVLIDVQSGNPNIIALINRVGLEEALEVVKKSMDD